VVAGSLTLFAQPASAACPWNQPGNMASVVYCRIYDSRQSVGSPSASDIATNILNRNAERQRALDQGFRQLQDILQARSARSSEPSVSNLRDKRLPTQQVGPELNPNAYYYPVRVDPEESTYRSSGGGASFGWPADEPVIDGSKIPSTIVFPQTATDPMTAEIRRQTGEMPSPPGPSISTDRDKRLQPQTTQDDEAAYWRGQLLANLPESTDSLGFPLAPHSPSPQLASEPPTDENGIITDRSLDIFAQVHNSYQKNQRKTR
jgi:hypothetical protein